MGKSHESIHSCLGCTFVLSVYIYLFIKVTEFNQVSLSVYHWYEKTETSWSVILLYYDLLEHSKLFDDDDSDKISTFLIFGDSVFSE